MVKNLNHDLCNHDFKHYWIGRFVNIACKFKILPTDKKVFLCCKCKKESEVENGRG